MITARKISNLGVLAASAALVSSTSGQTVNSSVGPTTPVPAPQPTGVEKAIQDIKQPCKEFNWGGDFRIRNEYFYNLLTLTPNNTLNEQDYFRFRGRLWANVVPVDDLSLNVRLASEPREWMQPAGYTPYKGNSGLDMGEGVFDSVNIKWKNIGGLPLAASLGRQDLFLGDGWLVGDGTPFDGSWTYFLDSARITYDLKDQNTTIDAIGIIQEAHDDAWMPTIGSNHRLLTEQNEKGAILQVANTSFKAANLTGYFIYKHDDAANMALADAQSFHPDNADIYTIGGRVNGLLSEHLKYWVEGAYQFGRKDYPILGPSQNPAYTAPAGTYRRIDAFGLNSKLTYMAKDKLNNQFAMSFEFLSGDNPNSSHDEMFDVLWGRWPRWSEAGLYSYAAETRIGQEANLIRFGPTWSLNPIKDLEFNASYYALFAQNSVPTLGATEVFAQGDPRRLFTDSGNFRGHFTQAVLKYKFSQHMTGHLWGELLFPGDYYVNQNMITFLRGEVMFTF